MDDINVNIETGAISYPQLAGFQLDKERMYRTAARFVGFCNGKLETAVKLAIHDQLSAFRGMNR